MLQMPEAMSYPSGEGHFNWMMLFSDGNRLDLTLIPIQRLELIRNDSLSIVLLDKDEILPHLPLANDSDYITKPPSELLFSSCCNNFWWCLQNVAKGIVRDELPYAMLMYHKVVLNELHDMLDWYIGVKNDFSVSTGKMGKYFKRYLPEHLYLQYCSIYSGCSVDELWQSIFTTCNLFHLIAHYVADHFHFQYKQDEEMGIREYMLKLKNNEYDYN